MVVVLIFRTVGSYGKKRTRVEVQGIVTEVTPVGAVLGIGELARLAGVPVRTVRFYCDQGLLDSVRSTGGHRRFAPAAVDRLRLIRQWRGLGLGLPAISELLAGRLPLTDALAAARGALDAEWAALGWRRAALRAVEEAAGAERVARLELLGSLPDGHAAQGAVLAFWQRLLDPALPADTVAMFVAVSVPAPPADPTPQQVVAYARLAALTADRDLQRRLRARARASRELVSDPVALLAGMDEAYRLADPLLRAGRRPAPGPALDRFVAAHAEVRGGRDTAAFRHELLTAFRRGTWTHVAVPGDPRIRRYWHLLGEATGEPVTIGTVHDWLVDALGRSVG